MAEVCDIYLARGLDRRINRYYIRCINLKRWEKEKENGAFNRYFTTGNSEDCSWCCSPVVPGAAAGMQQHGDVNSQAPANSQYPMILSWLELVGPGAGRS